MKVEHVKPFGFGIILEPVDRAIVDKRVLELKEAGSSFGMASDENELGDPVAFRVVAAGPGLQIGDAFIPNHIKAGDIVAGTYTLTGLAKKWMNKEDPPFTFEGLCYTCADSRDGENTHDVAAFKVEEA